MSDVATRQDIDEVIGIIRDFMERVDERFGEVEQDIAEIKPSIAGMQRDIADIKQDVIDLKQSHERLLNTIDGFIGRIDKYETELSARNNQFEKLLAWARKVSAKTGIPLENL